MKKSLFVLGVLALGLQVKAQKISVNDGSQKFSDGSHNAYSVTIYETSKSDVESKWKSFLKDFKTEKVKTEKGELFADNVLIKEWGNNPVDVYTTFEENKEAKTVQMNVAFNLGGAYLTGADGDKHKSAKAMIKDFAVKTTKESLGDKVKEQEKILGKLEDNQKDLEKENKGLKSDIDSYKSKIKSAEDNIAKNEEAQAKKKAEIEAQKKIVDAAKEIMNKVE